MDQAPRNSIPRRQAITRVVQAGVGLTFLDGLRREVNAQSAQGTNPAKQKGESDPQADTVNVRQEDVRSIRDQAAVKGSPPSMVFEKMPGTDDELRVKLFTKALRRAAPGAGSDGNLAETAGFQIMRNVLDAAYEHTFAEKRSESDGDFAAWEALKSHIGDSVNPLTPEILKQHFKFTNPFGGLSFDLEGTDPVLSKIKDAPAFESAETAAEMAELYWMALLRDVHFSELDPENPSLRVREAVDDLNKFPWFMAAPQGKIEYARFLRAELCDSKTTGKKGFKGVDIGPFLSQFLLRGTRDPGAGVALGGPERGVVSFGSLRLNLRQRTVLPGIDYLQTAHTEAGFLRNGVQEWHDVQNGSRKNIGLNAFDEGDLHFIRTLRDGANYVHFDEIYQEYLIAASILLASIPRVGDTKRSDTPGTSEINVTAHISESEGAAPSLLNYGNPYVRADAQVGFATFGVTQILTLLAEVADRAHKAGWYHKWRIRRLRPEEYGARVDTTVKGTFKYAVHDDLRQATGGSGKSDVLKRIRDFNQEVLETVLPTDKISYLLPMAFPEGCPTHPAYPSGHATVAGASTTVLKALFNETAVITHDPKMQFPSDDLPPAFEVAEQGLALQAYLNAAQKKDPKAEPTLLTIGGELHKLASNIIFFRGMAGMHWRSDNVEGVLLGERIALEILVAQTVPSEKGASFYRERWFAPSDTDKKEPKSPFFRLTTFAGDAYDIADGMMYPLDMKGHPEDQTKWERDSSKPPCSYEQFEKEYYKS